MSSLIDPKRIRIDLDTQSRVALNEDVVKEYQEAMEAGSVFPAILVFYDEPNDQFILADGFHRFAAHLRLKPNDQILAEQRLGTIEDARWESISSNKSHGLRRTNEDKRNAIKQALKHPKGAELSDRKIAEHVGVHHDTVSRIRKELELSGEIRQIENRTVQRGEQMYQQKTSQIGQKQSIQTQWRTCNQCHYFENDKCDFDGSDKFAWDIVCNEFAIRVEPESRWEPPPPDYNNIEICEDTDKKRRGQRLFQNRKLQNCIAVHLPLKNPQLFAVELREYFEQEYLVECFIALKHLLEDNDD
jgi:DNA-binding transcriptional regulator YhcF (GntR family)